MDVCSDGSAGTKCTLLYSQDDVYPHCNVDIPQGGEDDEKMAAVAAMAPHRALNGDTLTTMAAMAFYSCLPFCNLVQSVGVPTHVCVHYSSPATVLVHAQSVGVLTHACVHYSSHATVHSDGCADVKCTFLSNQDDVCPHCAVDTPQRGWSDKKVALTTAVEFKREE